MNRLLLVAIWYLGGLAPLFGSSDPDAQQLLTSARQQVDLFGDQASAFQLDIDFVAQTNVPTKGYLTLKWETKDRWWRKVVMGDYGQIEIRNGERLFIRRNAAFTPLGVRQLISLLAFPEGFANMTAIKETQRVEQGVQASCILVGSRGSKRPPHEVCIDEASHQILSNEWPDPPGELNGERFADYIDFRGHRFPRKLQLRVKGSEVLTADVTSMKAIAFDEALLIPPQGAIERRQCADMKAPVLLEKVRVPYPASARRNGMAGDTIAALTILADGTVENAQIIGRATHTMDEAALKSMKKWKFEPAMCGADPVVSDIEVVVSFRDSLWKVPGIAGHFIATDAVVTLRTQ